MASGCSNSGTAVGASAAAGATATRVPEYFARVTSPMTTRFAPGFTSSVTKIFEQSLNITREDGPGVYNRAAQETMTEIPDKRANRSPYGRLHRLVW